ncbi:interferon-induced protein 44-like [Sebastes fasciatus]|uniref:interferon-induced protein 44-like n=1 Tax=Sebastes fasciatus TaxID=394691 RepID=UPI003D9F8D46
MNIVHHIQNSFRQVNLKSNLTLSLLNSHKEIDLTFVKDFQPHNDEVQQLRVLLYGLTGSGKSSFINSVESVLRGRITGQALEDATIGKSFTTKYRTYKIQKGDRGTFYPFAFTDIMGLEVGTHSGVGLEDIKLAMKGHIKDGYTFKPCSEISEDNQYYNKDPTLKDRVHVLVCVISASTVNMLSTETITKMREVRLAATDMGIPQLAILTKIDEACPEVNTDIRNLSKSKYLKEKTYELSGTMGFTPNCIFPVKNYYSEIDTNDDTDALILSALRRMITYGEDFVNSQ